MLCKGSSTTKLGLQLSHIFYHFLFKKFFKKTFFKKKKPIVISNLPNRDDEQTFFQTLKLTVYILQVSVAQDGMFHAEMPVPLTIIYRFKSMFISLLSKSYMKNK